MHRLYKTKNKRVRDGEKRGREGVESETDRSGPKTMNREKHEVCADCVVAIVSAFGKTDHSRRYATIVFSFSITVVSRLHLLKLSLSYLHSH